MKIGVILTMAFITVSIVATIAGVYTYHSSAEVILEKQVHNHLNSVAESRAAHIETSLDEEKRITLQLSKSVVVERLLLSNKTDEEYNDRLSEVITRLKNSASINEEIYDIFILDTNGIVIASNIGERIGLDRSDDDYFINGRDGIHVKDIYYSRFSEGTPSLAVSAPFLDDKSNTLLGVVVIRFNLDPLDYILTDRTGLGETGETYLINKDGYMITSSRFVNDTFLKQKIDTPESRECYELSGEGEIEKEEIRHYESYYGEMVIGTHYRIEEMSWCLLAEISEGGALGVQRTELINISQLIIFSILFCVSIVGFLVSRLISKPIENLTKTVDDVSMGKLSVRIKGKERDDEIGDLARAFDRTLVSLKLAMKQTAPELKKESDKLKKILEEKEKAEETLKESQRYTRELIETSLDPLVTISPEGKITDVNHATELVTGCPREKLIGSDFSDYFTDPEKARQGYQQVFKEGHVRDYPLEIRHRDGKVTPVLYNASVYHDTKGDVAGVFAAARDITERKHVEIRKKRK